MWKEEVESVSASLPHRVVTPQYVACELMGGKSHPKGAPSVLNHLLRGVGWDF